MCRCGVEVKWVDTPTGRLPIEPNITITLGPDRYRVVAFGDRWKAEPLDPSNASSGHPDHRTRCPR